MNSHPITRRLFSCIFPLALLCAPLSAFEENSASGNQVLLRTDASWNGAPNSPQSIAHPEVTLVRIKIPPKKSLPTHRHGMINVAYVVAGTLRVKTESGKTIVLKKGDAINEVVGTWHYGENIGDDEVELLVFYVGEKGTPLSEKKPQ